MMMMRMMMMLMKMMMVVVRYVLPVDGDARATLVSPSAEQYWLHQIILGDFPNNDGYLEILVASNNPL